MFKIVHVSDLHLRSGWAEEQGPILAAFFSDLEKRNLKKGRDFFLFSGDLVAEGASLTHIDEFRERFSPQLDKHFALEDRIFCPGNHEVDRNYIKQHLSLLLPLARAIDDETKFNNDISTENFASLISKKFSNCFKLTADLFGASLTQAEFFGRSFQFPSKCSFYVVNSALYSFGGLEEAGNRIDDDGLLRVETRKLREWITRNSGDFKVLVMHHPTSWLVPWARKAIETIARKHFDLFLHGHLHDPSNYQRIYPDGRVITLSAPALHTRKADPYLGYSVISIEGSDEIAVEYRQWSPTVEEFVTGAPIAGVDGGIVYYRNDPTKNKAPFVPPTLDALAQVQTKLQETFDNTLNAYRSLGKEFVEPRLSESSEFDQEKNADDKSAIDAITDSSASTLIILAPQLFGLTTLGHHLALEWWIKNHRLLLYLQMEELPSHKNGMADLIEKRLSESGLTSNHLAGVIIDSSGVIGKAEVRKSNGLRELYPHVRQLFLQRMRMTDVVPNLIGELSNIPHELFYLRSLGRQNIRALVRAEIEHGIELDEDYITQRVADDLEVLNIHRTPLHVKTLLAIARVRADVGPINRAEMLLQFLLLVFRNNVNLTYETLPDLKDSAFALGYFCAQLLRSGVRTFTKREFLDEVEKYCREKAVDLDVHVIFEILARERMIVNSIGGYVFHYTYWIYFFAAHHMYASEEFRDYVIKDCNYSRFPEVIEFYSAIDRHRKDLISILTSQLAEHRKAFEARSQIPISANYYDHLNWIVDQGAVTKMSEQMVKFLEETDLPTEIKDQIADQSYSYDKPYRQDLRRFIDQASLAKNMNIMMAAARALRNSDHVDKDHKISLLREILFIWKQLVQTGLLLANDMAHSQTALYEDVLFVADWTQNDTPEKSLAVLIRSMPSSVARLFFTDLATKRMGPLFEASIELEQDDLVKFFLVMQVVLSKPKDWVRIVGEYISKLSSNSYYLWALHSALRRDYKSGFHEANIKDGLRSLLVRIVAKHQLNIANPNNKTTKDIDQQLKEHLDELPKDEKPEIAGD